MSHLLAAFAYALCCLEHTMYLNHTIIFVANSTAAAAAAAAAAVVVVVVVVRRCLIFLPRYVGTFVRRVPPKSNFRHSRSAAALKPAHQAGFNAAAMREWRILAKIIKNWPAY